MSGIERACGERARRVRKRRDAGRGVLPGLALRRAGWLRVLGLGVAVSLLGLLGHPAPAEAQVSPADSAAVLAAAAADLADRGDDDAARTLWEEIVRRWPGTAGAETALARLAALGASEDRDGERSGDRAGETGFKVWSTMYGVWVGVAVPSLAGASGTEPYGAGILVGGPAAYIAARAFAGSHPLSAGQSRAITWGGTWGTWQGIGWANALDLGADPCTPPEGVVRDCDPDGDAVVGSALAGGVAGILAGALLSAGGTANGTSSSAFLGSLWGTWIGLAGARVVDWQGNAEWRAALLAGNAGLVGGALAARGGRISVRRAHLISLGGLIGGTSGLGIVLIARPYDESAEFGIPLAGSVAGLILGALLTGDDAGSGTEGDAGGNASAAPAILEPGALLNWSGGRFSLGVPLPIAATVRSAPTARGSGPESAHHTEWTVPLLRVRF